MRPIGRLTRTSAAFANRKKVAPKPEVLSHRDAVAFVRSWLRFPVQEMTVELMKAAFSTAERWQISYWDAAIIEAARATGCHEVLSEDFSHGQDYGGVTVVNPFV
jgi:predicted nucleic acid-binding protein